MVDAIQELVVRQDGRVGFYLHCDREGKASQEDGQVVLLKQGFSACNHEARWLMSHDLAIECVEGERFYLTVLIKLRPIPGVLGIAPGALQVAEGKAKKHAGDPDAGPFALDTREKLRHSQRRVCKVRWGWPGGNHRTNA